MKIRNVVCLLFAIALLTYAGWALLLASRGHNIAKHDLGIYQVRVDRVPHKFSLLTPAYGSRWFPGYIKFTVSSLRGMPITSYSVNWDSFYPDQATITANPEGLIRIEMAGAVVVCQMGSSTITWATTSK